MELYYWVKGLKRQFCSADPFELLHKVVLLLHQVAIRDLAALHHQLARPAIHHPSFLLCTRTVSSPEHPPHQGTKGSPTNYATIISPCAPLTSPRPPDEPFPVSSAFHNSHLTA